MEGGGSEKIIYLFILLERDNIYIYIYIYIYILIGKALRKSN